MCLKRCSERPDASRDDVTRTFLIRSSPAWFVISHGAGVGGKWWNHWEFISGSIIHMVEAGIAKRVNPGQPTRIRCLHPSDKRRAENAAKRAKLEETRKVEARLSVANPSYAPSQPPHYGLAPISMFEGITPPPKPDERDLDD